MGFKNTWDLEYIETKEELRKSENKGNINKVPVFCYVQNSTKDIIVFYGGEWKLWLYEKNLIDYTFDIKLNKARGYFFNIEFEKVKELNIKIK